MAKLVFGLNQSLDGYVDYLEFAPGPSACGEDFVSATGSIIDETRAVPLSAASSLGVFTLLLTSP